jgi:replicative DNA helicase
MAKATVQNLPETQTMPQNLDAEKKVLGAMIRDREAVFRAIEVLTDISFYQPSHQKIFQALVDLSSHNTPIDLLTLGDLLEKKGELETVGGAFYLAELVKSITTSANIEIHAQIVSERAMRRQLIRQCTEIQLEAFQGSEDIGYLLHNAESRIFQLSQGRSTRSFTPIGMYLQTAIDKIQEAQNKKSSLTGVTTGFKDLDTMTSGFQRSDLIVIAARPSVGKTSLVLNIAEAVALAERKPVGIFSLEMSNEQIAERVLCSQARVNLKHLRSGFFTKKEAGELMKTASIIQDIPLFVDDTPNLSPVEVLSRARKLKSEQKDIGLLIIDYLQLMSGSRHTDNRQQEISEISRALKILARELDVPVIACSQLSRAVEKRDDHMPRLSDLRESGAIEQDADLVIFIHREPLKGQFDGEGDEDLESGKQTHYSYKLVIGKHRNGPVGEVEIYFDSACTRFADAANLNFQDDADVPF